MKTALRIVSVFALVSVVAVGCGKKKEGGGGGGEKGLKDMAALLTVVEARQKAMCACTDQPCASGVEALEPGAFGERGRAIREKASPEDQAKFNAFQQEYLKCVGAVLNAAPK